MFLKDLMNDCSKEKVFEIPEYTYRFEDWHDERMFASVCPSRLSL